MALVTSANSGTLIEVGDRPGADMTARLLLALTALYVQRPTHTAEEQQQYIELALRLIDKVEAGTRTAVAGILQRHPDAPAEVVARLGGRQSSRHRDPEGEPHSAQDQRLAGNQRFESNPHPADLERAPTPTSSNLPAVRQLAPIPSEFGEAFFVASPAERRRLLSLATRGERDDVQAAPADGELLHEKVDAAALQGQIGAFTCEFAQLIDSPNSLCKRILNDPWGEPMVVAAKAAGMPIAMLQHILLLVSASASYSVERVYDLTELYHGLDGRAARDLLAQWRAQAKLNDPSPETEPDGAGLRRDAPRRPADLPPQAGKAVSICPPPLPGEGRVRASLRSRFGALTERVRNQAISARCDRGSAAQGGIIRPHRML